MAEEDRRASEAARSKSERKKWKQDQELLLDEMLPKASGREAALEKKAVRREQQRGREDRSGLPAFVCSSLVALEVACCVPRRTNRPT